MGADWTGCSGRRGDRTGRDAAGQDATGRDTVGGDEMGWEGAGHDPVGGNRMLWEGTGRDGMRWAGTGCGGSAHLPRAPPPDAPWRRCGARGRGGSRDGAQLTAGSGGASPG